MDAGAAPVFCEIHAPVLLPRHLEFVEPKAWLRHFGEDAELVRVPLAEMVVRRYPDGPIMVDENGNVALREEGRYLDQDRKPASRESFAKRF